MKRQAVQCRVWNADRDHQAQAGKARAAQFTLASQSQAGHASFAAFSARWRAEQGLAPLAAEDVRRYLTPADIRLLGQPLTPQLQAAIYHAWCAGQLWHVTAWLSDEDPPPDPHGLWAERKM